MYQKTDGKIYQGVVRTMEISRELEILEDEIFGAREN